MKDSFHTNQWRLEERTSSERSKKHDENFSYNARVLVE